MLFPSFNPILMHQRILLCLYSLLCTLSLLHAQPRQARVQVVVSPEAPGWTYMVGQRADFQVMVLQDGQLLAGQPVRYSIGPEQMPASESGEWVLKDGRGRIKGIELSQPGFVRCQVSTEVDGHTYEAWGTAGFAPEAIRPVVADPADFDSFWAQAKAELAAIPPDARLTLLPERCTERTNVYQLSLQNIDKSRFYGVLSVPKAPGRYPALLQVPGAGARPYYGDVSRADSGLITLQVGIHGIPIDLDPGVYQDLMAGAIGQYWINKLDDRDRYYYKRVYLGCVRAIDYLFSMEAFDGERLAVTGGSQGGALSIVIAGLDSRVKYLAAFYPALCDLTGYLQGRAGGWPHMFKHFDAQAHPRWQEVAAYYDVVNFARRVRVPGWYSWGYNDNVCPPTSMYAAYNVIDAPRELYLALETAHWTFPEQQERATAWLLRHLRQP
ncbi:MAG: acetylxylan esterase [Bacteroidia bacterium]